MDRRSARRDRERGETIEPLDGLGVISFTAATTVQNGQPVDLAQAGAQAITMTDSTKQPLAVPSAIGTDGSSFS